MHVHVSVSCNLKNLKASDSDHAPLFLTSWNECPLLNPNTSLSLNTSGPPLSIRAPSQEQVQTLHAHGVDDDPFMLEKTVSFGEFRSNFPDMKADVGPSFKLVASSCDDECDMLSVSVLVTPLFFIL